MNMIATVIYKKDESPLWISTYISPKYNYRGFNYMNGSAIAVVDFGREHANLFFYEGSDIMHFVISDNDRVRSSPYISESEMRRHYKAFARWARPEIP